jgi:hypothetical protein
MSFVVHLTERGASEFVPIEHWQTLGLEAALQALDQRGIVRLQRSSAGVLITPANFVGELRLPRAVIRISPKSPKTLAAMEALALKGREKRIRNRQSRQDHSGEAETNPAAAFVAALNGCIHDGIPWRYARQHCLTSFPRGTLDVSATIRLASARGITHKVAVSKPVQVHRSDVQAVVQAASACLPLAPGATPRLLAEAETLMSAFGPSASVPAIKEAIRIAQHLLMNPADLRQSVCDLLEASLDLLLEEFEKAADVWEEQGAVARFRNLEELWERVVAVLVEHAPVLSKGCPVVLHGLAASGVTLFENGGPALDPDVTVGSERVIAIIDAKYKRSEGAAAAADLYQLYAYVRRTKARLGLLVHYAEDLDAFALVGTTDEGVPVLSAAVSAGTLLRDGQLALRVILGEQPRVLEVVERSNPDGLGEQGADGVTNLLGDILLGSDEHEIIRK